jgi:zinc/manganese transport system permease protein
MNLDGFEFSILGPAMLAGILVLATHVPLGREVLARGIIFIDLAVAQISSLGVIAADRIDLHMGDFGVELAAAAAAISGALILTWTERHLGEIQEALIGILFVLAATGGILLLADNPHGGDRLKELLVGQILWVNVSSLWPVALLYAGVLALWFGLRERLGRVGFYLLFAVTVTASVRLVGVFLVFASLIVPSVATRRGSDRHGLSTAYLLGLAGYALGLVLSVFFDLPTGAMIVWSLALVAVIWMAARQRASPRPGEA